MNRQVCVNCQNKKAINQTNNRLVTESCGHVKCMDCLLREKAGCEACMREGSEHENGDYVEQKDKGKEICVQEITVEFEKLDESLQKDQSDSEDLSKKQKPEISHIRIETDGNGRCYVCTVCKKRFHARSQVVYHAYCNGQKKPYQCSRAECNNKSFATLSHFKYHMRVHLNDRTFSCDVCGESFFQMSKLQRHKLIHSKEKRFSCSECNKSFGSVSSLRSHTLTHSVDRPYACAICSRRFRDPSNYRKHLYNHRDKKGCCGICGMKSETREALIEHMRVEHNTRTCLEPARRSHQCPRCPQTFHSGKDMRRHAAVHSDSKPFRCKVCDRRFRRKDNLERHIRNTHPSYVPANAVDCDESALKQIKNAHTDQMPDKSDITYRNEKIKLEILNPLPPLPQEVIQKHIETNPNRGDPPKETKSDKQIEVNENVSQNNQVTGFVKSYILEANIARESVIVGKKNITYERKATSPIPEYVHKIRKANSMALNCQKELSLPPMDEQKFLELEEKDNMNKLDVGTPMKNVEIYKKILYERLEKDSGVVNEDDVKMQTNPKLHWRKMKLNINW